MEFDLDFPHAFGRPELIADFRCTPEDFRVDENLGFVPTGEGEHLLVQIQKRGQNTQWAAEQIADFVGVSSRDVGYCGLKDRHAVTTQWFSIYWPKASEVNWSQFQVAGLTILDTSRHLRKLKPGEHQSNNFDILLRNVRDTEGKRLPEIDMLEYVDKKTQALSNGIPNYFGEQRFGRDASNLIRFEHWCVSWLKSKDKKNFSKNSAARNRKQHGLMLSAARSYLFNLVLGERVEDNTWATESSGSIPTGPLWGRGRSLAAESDIKQELQVLEPWQSWCETLEHVGLKQERRTLVLLPQNFQATVTKEGMGLSFSLMPGQYATVVLREFCQTKNTQAK